MKKLNKKIIVYLNSHFQDNNLRLAIIAGEFELSSLYFSRLFTPILKESFRNYLENLRIEFVIEELLNTDKPLEEIAYAAGYSSLNTCSKAFKRKYGYSATEYIKREENHTPPLILSITSNYK